MKDNLTFDTKRAHEFFSEKISFMASPNELHEMIKNQIEKINVVDVRSYDDYIEGHIPYAIHIPYEALDEHLIMFEKEKINIIYSYSAFCKLAHKTAIETTKKGYPTMVLYGGYNTWRKMGFDTVKTGDDSEI